MPRASSTRTTAHTTWQRIGALAAAERLFSPTPLPASLSPEHNGFVKTTRSIAAYRLFSLAVLGSDRHMKIS